MATAGHLVPAVMGSGERSERLLPVARDGTLKAAQARFGRGEVAAIRTCHPVWDLAALDRAEAVPLPAPRGAP